MHTALCIPELCALVARDSVLGSADLARLALVSRTWREAAEEVLWEELPDILCLLRLLPDDLWYTATEPSQDEVYHSAYEPRVSKLRRELKPMDWTPLLRKSDLVKILTVTNYPSVQVQQAIMECPAPPKILRRLSTLHLTTSMNATFLGALVPLGAITAVRIAHPGASLSSSTIIFLEIFPNVTNLTLKLRLVGASEQVKAESLLKVLALAKSIRRLSLLLTMWFALPSQYFMHCMSQLPALTDLDIQLNRCEGARDYRSITYAPRGFAALQHLKLSRLSTQMLVDILRASAPCRLQTIDIDYRVLEDAEIEPLISAICTHCARSTLHHLSIAAFEYFGDNGVRYLAPLGTFEQLEVRFMDKVVPYTYLTTSA